MQGYKVKEKTAIVPVGKPHTDSVPPTMQSQIPKSRDVTLFFLDMTLYINPMVSIHMIKCFVLPRLLYGLDVIRLTKTDIKNLSTYFVQYNTIQYFYSN